MSAIIPTGNSQLAHADVELVTEYVRNAKAENTERAYRGAVRIFVSWCEGRGLVAMPATPETVAAFMADEAKQGRKVSTLGQRLAAIRCAHELAGRDDPTGHALVRETLKGIRREVGIRPERKSAATVDRISAMLAHIDRDTLTGKRDAALLLFGFMAAFRRSELAALNLEDIEVVPQGLLVLVAKSKTDQEGEGDYVAVPYGRRDELCPVRAMAAYIEAAGITEGLVFRSITRNGGVGESISGGAIGQLVKRLAKRAGLKSAEFGGHSLRRGFVTSAAENGANPAAIQRHGRWETAAMVNVYTETVDIWKGHAGDGLL